MPVQELTGCEADEKSATSEPAAPSPAQRLRAADLMEGARRLATAREALGLILHQGLTQRAAARRLGLGQKALCLYLQVLRQNPAASAADFAPRRANSGRRRSLRLTEGEVAAARRWKLSTNRTALSGSTPEALRQAARAGELRAEVAELIAERAAAGRALLPEAALRELHIAEPLARAARAPRGAALEYTHAPGSLHLAEDPETGADRLVRPGERWTIDDGSINLVVVVPGLERPGDRCFDRWGVCVGRFQLLLVVDHRTRFITGWGFTARPRDSYRAEDITATLQNAMLEHGAPREMVLEHGVSAAQLITETCAAAGIRIRRARGPHTKVVESVFNSLWTKLSVLPGQVGRYRGEEEECNRLLARIRDGAVDPRGLLMDLPALLAALRDAVVQLNAQVVNSERYGRWVPAEWFEREAGRWLQPVSGEDAWMFSPVITEPLLVRGCQVRKAVPLLPGLSDQFVFGADWLMEFHGARVKLFFNPFSAVVTAKAVLAEAYGPHRAGQVLGDLPQIDALTRLHRRALGYGLDPDEGLAALRSHQQALRRHVTAIRTDGRTGHASHEVRSGTGLVAQAQTRLMDPAPPDRRSSPLSPEGEPGRVTDPRLQLIEEEVDLVSS